MPIIGSAVQFSRTGNPVDVVEVEEISTPDPTEGEILCQIEAAPIAPSHILTLSGVYGDLPDLPAVPGNDALAKVIKLGSGVSDFQIGDQFLLPRGSGSWRQYATVKAKDIIVTFPPGGNPLQLSMLLANPPTAYLMLTQYLNLQSGDWVIQNASNSSTGQYLIQLARYFGWKTVCVVRREESLKIPEKCGGDVVLVDGTDLAERVKEATGGADIKLGLDAVAGSATERISSCLSPKATIVNYGLLSGEPCQVKANDLVFREITLTGFWLNKWLREKSTSAEREQVYALLRDLVVKGILFAEVEATYPISKAKEAVAHSTNGSKRGKILFTPQIES